MGNIDVEILRRRARDGDTEAKFDLALRYSDGDLLGWEEEPFPGHLWQVLGAPQRHRVEIHFFEPERVECPIEAASRLEAAVRDHVERART